MGNNKILNDLKNSVIRFSRLIAMGIAVFLLSAAVGYILDLVKVEDKTEYKGDIELADGYAKECKFSSALREYNTYIDNHKKISEVVYNNRAVCKIEIGDLEGAAEDLEKAIKQMEDYVIAHINRAQIYELENQYYRAVSELNRALELDPNYAPIYNNRGVVYRKMGNLEQALNDFNQAITLDDDKELYYFNRSYCQYLLGRIDAAVADLRKALELNPSFYQASTMLQRFKMAGLMP